MKPSLATIILFIITAIYLSGCAAKPPIIPVDDRSVQPGETITRGGNTTLQLLGEPIRVGERFPEVNLVDLNLKTVNLTDYTGEVLLVSIVPSLDTQVCERQTHILGEDGAELSPEIRRVTISRDLPFAHKRFADLTGFDDILFLSDYQQANFGKSTGLLVDQIYLLARAMMVVDQQGVIRYIQVVPEISHLPDMQEAFSQAEALLDKP